MFFHRYQVKQALDTCGRIREGPVYAFGMLVLPQCYGTGTGLILYNLERNQHFDSPDEFDS